MERIWTTVIIDQSTKKNRICRKPNWPAAYFVCLGHTDPGLSYDGAGTAFQWSENILVDEMEKIVDNKLRDKISIFL